MATVIDALLVTLNIDVSGFKSGQKQASSDLRKTAENSNAAAKSIEASGRVAAQFFSRLRTEAIGLFAVFTASKGISGFIREVTEGDAAVGRAAKNLGMATDELAKWQGAADRSGGSASGITSSMQAMSDVITKFRETGQSDESFQWLDRLGVKLTNANGQYKTMSQLYADINASPLWQKLSMQDKLGFASHFHADAGTAQTLAQTPGALNKIFADEAKRGLPTDADAARAIALNNAILDLHQSMDGLWRTIQGALSPALVALMDQFDNFLQSPKAKEAINNAAAELRQFGDYLVNGIPWEKFKDRAAAVFDYLVHGVPWNAIIESLKVFGAGLADVAKAMDFVVTNTVGWQTAVELLFGLWLGSKFLAVIGNVGKLVGATAGVSGLLAKLGAVGIAAGVAHEALSAIDPDDKTGSWIDKNIPGAGALDDWVARHLGIGFTTDEQQKRDPNKGQPPDLNWSPAQEWMGRLKTALPSWLGGGQPDIADKSMSTEQQAFLKTLSAPESAGSYRVLNGGESIDDLSQHPGRVGKGGTSTAAGRYQFTASTWADEARKLGLTDFSPASQDKAAWDLASTKYRENTARGLMDDLKAGGHEEGIANALKMIWPSLPSGSQTHQGMDAFKTSLNMGLGRNPAGDLSAGAGAMAARYAVSQGQANDNSTQIDVRGITINAKSGDVKDIASGIKAALNSQFSTQLNRGLA